MILTTRIAAMGTFLGTTAGLVVGAVAGCILGLPLFGIGCVPAAVAGAGLGSILGTIVVGGPGPVLVLSAVELVETLAAPDGTSKWANISERRPAN
ncbi:hypothetical protein [Nocardia arizonensis]|uniref:hypothetical protein n=1 Tax=Nocardia arizonensis TaxID=1141647 RepID=UPI0006D125FD|nr:hypothetical protein [Nocardia arizonensis]